MPSHFPDAIKLIMGLKAHNIQITITYDKEKQQVRSWS